MTNEQLEKMLQETRFPCLLGNELDRVLYKQIAEQYGSENSVVTHNPDDNYDYSDRRDISRGSLRLKPGYIVALNQLLGKYDIRTARLSEIQKYLKENPETLHRINSGRYEDTQKGIYVPTSIESGILANFECTEKYIYFRDVVQKDFLMQLKERLGNKAYEPHLVHYDQIALEEDEAHRQFGL